jgi:UV DNA damage endonuclease
MCRRPFARLLHGLSFQHAGSLEAGPQGRHTSLRITDRSIPVTRTGSVTDARHVALNSLHFTSRRIEHPLVTSPYFYLCRRTYSQALGREPSYLNPEDRAMAADTGSEAKPADILDGDIPSADCQASLDPESDEEIPIEADELKEALGRPPPIHSSYLPLPWKGRLGYVSQPCSEHCTIW